MIRPLSAAISITLLTLTLTDSHCSPDSVVVFNEVHYNPAGPEESTEWVELFNQMGIMTDVSGWRLDGIEYTIPENTFIEPGGYLVIAKVPGPGQIGPFSGNINNGGETLRLYNKGNRLMDELSFGDGGRWPAAADGSGTTLAKVLPYSANKPPENWAHSVQLGGTPGRTNFPSSSEEIPTKKIKLINLNDEWRYNESGNDLGPSWSEQDHALNDEWKSGKGGIGFESGTTIPLETRLNFPSRNDPYVITYYFEREFDLRANQLSNLDSLILRHAIDDGALIHINGKEVLRVNMPDGNISYSDLASENIEVDELSSEISVDISGLIAGNNLISVEVHQSRIGNSDIVFGLDLAANIIDSPESTDGGIIFNEIPAYSEENFWVELVNPNSSEVNVGGMVLSVNADTEKEYSFPDQIIGPGDFLVLDQEKIGFRPENGEKLFLYSPSLESVLDAREQTGRLRGRAEQRNGSWLYPNKKTPGQKNIFNLNESIVISEICYNPPALPAIPPIAPTYENIPLVPINGNWKMNRSETGLPNDWANTNHALGGEWETGSAPIGRETGTLPVPLTTAWSQADYSSRLTTYYFETNFLVPATVFASAEEILLTHMIDDGAVFYLNGTEIGRFNMPEGPINSQTIASPTVSNAKLETLSISLGALRVGENRLSIETHQGSQSSSDIVFGASLEARLKITEGIEGKPYRSSNNQWIEIANKSNSPMNLGGWDFGDGVEFKFPEQTILDPGEHACIAARQKDFIQAYPDARLLGTFDGNLSRSGERIVLRDSNKNPVDDIRYHDSGRWSSAPDGGGSTLELRDLDADNFTAEAWSQSDESSRTKWKNYSYRGSASSSGGPDSQWSEFNVGLLNAGEVLIDDISVIEDPDGQAKQILRNSNFSDDTNHWRLRGNHRHSEIIEDPEEPGNKVLRVVATSGTGHMHNQMETTLLSRVRNGTDYEISFRARWVSGTNLLHSRLYFNRLAHTTVIERPEHVGTPSAINTSSQENIGPTYYQLNHEPAVPNSGQTVRVSVKADDPEGINSMRLYYSVNGRSFKSLTMGIKGGKYYATIPAQTKKSVVQFYVRGRDQEGALSFFPAAGPDSRALYKVDDGLAATNGWHNFRIVTTNADRDFIHKETEVMSNDRIGVTVIDRENDIYYDVKMRLKGSERARSQDPRVGYNFRFGSDQLYRGIHRSLAIDRSEGVGSGQLEILFDIMIANSGGIVSRYYDFIKVLAPMDRHTRGATLQMARYDEVLMESQFGENGEGNLFEYELLYYPTTNSGAGLKRPQPDGVTGTSVRNLGDDPEKYRWFFLKRNNKEANNFEPIMNYAKLFSRSGSDFEREVENVVNVDAWFRGMAYAVLSGAGDNAGAGSQHNGMYYAFPDGRVMFLPHDMDFAFSSSRSITANPECSKLTQNEIRRRIYYGHLQDIITTTYNRSYMSKWTNHLKELDPSQNWNGHLSYVNSRSSNVLSQIRSIPEIQFSISSPSTIETQKNIVGINGKGWINVREVRVKGSDENLPLQWSDKNTWELSLPAAPGRQTFNLEAIDFSGQVIGNDSVTIISSAESEPASSQNIVVSEIMYHPADPSITEIEAGFTDADQFEFIELLNIGDKIIDLSGSRFVNGIDYEFESGSLLGSGDRIVIARNRSAFLNRNPDASSWLATKEFSNSTGLANGGERLRLLGIASDEIRNFVYDDKRPWPEGADGSGHSLNLINAQNSPDHSLSENWTMSSELGGTPGQGDDGLSQENLDQDNDGLSAFAENALGTSDDSPNAPFMISFDGEGKTIITHTRNRNAEGILFSIQLSNDLNSWQDAAEEYTKTSDTSINEEINQVIWRSSSSKKSAQFLRLKISR
ncbi:MAG: lamin tail domain-containing protein [Verrucomicrobiales bacterium]|nr:lamin tail domain-containing protein [Verrucomicrobiales bacterium]